MSYAQDTGFPRPTGADLDREDNAHTRLRRLLRDKRLLKQATDYAHLREELHARHVVTTIADHLPGLAPAIYALALHACDEDPASGCCGLPLWPEGRDGDDDDAA